MKNFINALITVLVVVATAFIIAHTFIKTVECLTDYFSPNDTTNISKINIIRLELDSLYLLQRQDERQSRLYDRDSWNDSKAIDEYLNRDNPED